MAAVEPIDRTDRRRRGAWYTPPALVRFLVDQAVVPAAAEAARRGRPLRVLDLACGDARLLVAAAEAATAVGAVADVVGVESDRASAAEARRAAPEGRVIVGDGRHVDTGGPFDVVLGNPPYLGQLARATSRGGRSPLGGGPYADVAAEFLLRSVALVRPDGGRVALVLPQSILASRDTVPVRAAVLQQAALVGLWWAGTRVFEAEVDVCIAVLRRGVEQTGVARWHGTDVRPVGDAPATSLAGPTWSGLVADLAGIPAVDLDVGHGRLGDLATATAGFRDQYYGLLPHVGDGVDGPPLVTAGLIDVGRCGWGQRPARFARRRFDAPRVDVAGLAATAPHIAAWYRRQLRPKVLVATQTRVIEAVADPAGAWLPSVPVIAVHPRRVDDLWAVAAVLTAPPLAAWAAGRYVGAGLGGSALKLSATQLLDLPLPVRPWGRAGDLLRRGELEACARAMCDAYGVTGRAASDLLDWWRVGAFSSRRAPVSL